MVARAAAVDLPNGAGMAEAVAQISRIARKRWSVDGAWLKRRMLSEARRGLLHERPGVALLHVRTLTGLAQPELVVVRFPDATEGPGDDANDQGLSAPPLRVLFVLVSPSQSHGTHLHKLMTLSRLLQDPGLLGRVLAAKPKHLPRVLTLRLEPGLRFVRNG